MKASLRRGLCAGEAGRGRKTQGEAGGFLSGGGREEEEEEERRGSTRKRKRKSEEEGGRRKEERGFLFRKKLGDGKEASRSDSLTQRSLEERENIYLPVM